VRVAIVGAGAIARTHLEHLGALGHEVVAVCDPLPERARVLAAPIGAEVHADWRPMLETVRMDALFVCSPPATHAAPACAALERGIPVYLEKPLARSLHDGREIVAAWEASGCVCAIGYQWRSLDVVAAAREALAGSAPGLLVSRSFGGTEPARGDLSAAAAGSWFSDPRQSGGILFELGSHDIDVQRALAGEVESVQATAGAGRLALAGRDPAGRHDAVSATLRFRDGGIGAIHVGWSAEGSPSVYTLDVLASEATLALDLGEAPTLRGRAKGRTIVAADTLDARLHTHERFFAAAGRGDAAAVACTPRDALGTLAVALACESAIATGGEVEVGTVPGGDCPWARAGRG
jgi:myo-inositol 2-dehydrogenase / D-chiro-inositol 1-dehydrogenase